MAFSCKQADIERVIVRLEEKGWAALAAGRGVEFYSDNFADEGLMVFASGAFDKTQALQGLAAASAWSRYTLGAMRVCWLSDASVALTYDVEAQRTGEPLYRAIMTSTYVQRGGQWLLMLHTQTPREST